MHSKYDEIQEILENYRKQLPEPNPGWPHEVRRAVRFIHKYLFDPKLAVGWLKEQSHINGEYFLTLFKSYTGKGIKQYIQELRLEAAKQILADESLQQMSILELAVSMGYSGKGAFIHAFKKQGGLPPGRWRSQRLA